MPDPCSWRAWDVGQHILPPPHQGLLLCDPADGKLGSTTLALHASEPKSAAPAGLCLSHWLGEPVLLSSVPGQGQFKRFT